MGIKSGFSRAKAPQEIGISLAAILKLTGKSDFIRYTGFSPAARCCHRLVQIGPMRTAQGLMTEFQKMNKILLVCSEPAGQVDRCLRGVGPQVVKVNDGETAIRQAHRALFDLVIVVSTGSVMDMAETVLNLTDIRPSTEIIMLGEGCGSAAEAISHAFPNTKAMTLNGLVEYLGLSPS